MDEMVFCRGGPFTTGGSMFLSLTKDCLQKKVFNNETFSGSEDAIILPSMSVGIVVV